MQRFHFHIAKILVSDVAWIGNLSSRTSLSIVFPMWKFDCVLKIRFVNYFFKNKKKQQSIPSVSWRIRFSRRLNARCARWGRNLQRFIQTWAAMRFREAANCGRWIRSSIYLSIERSTKSILVTPVSSGATVMKIWLVLLQKFPRRFILELFLYPRCSSGFIACSTGGIESNEKMETMKTM